MNAFGFMNQSDKTGAGITRGQIIEEPLHDGDLRLCPAWLRITDREVKSHNAGKQHKENNKVLDQLELF